MIASPLIKVLLLLVLGAASLSLHAEESKEEAKLARRAAKIAISIETMQIDENSKIPPNIMKRAKGIIVLRQYEAGVIFGAKGGFGIAMKKQADGTWGPPAWIKTGEISGGLQLGVQTLNVVLLIMNEEGLRMLDKPKFQVGVDATVTRGPTGTTFGARIGQEIDLLAYTDTEGFYAGATFEGGFLLPDRKANNIAYEERLSVAQIIADPTLEKPKYAQKISSLLAEIEASGEVNREE